MSATPRIRFLLAVVAMAAAAHGSCIPPFNLRYFDKLDRLHKHTFQFNGESNITAELNDFSNAYGLDISSKLHVYEKMMEHVAMYSGRRDITRGTFIKMDTKSIGEDKINSIQKAMAILPESSFPNRVWTTATSPPFEVALSGENEFMGIQIMGAYSSWLYDQIDRLISGTRNFKLQNNLVVVDVGANLGMVALYAAAKGEDVVAFEASSHTAHMLISSCILNSWCSQPENVSNNIDTNYFNDNARFAVFENAVSDADGQDITMRVNWLQTDEIPNHGSNSMFPVEREKSNDSTCIFETIKSITLDTALAKLGLVPRSSDVDPRLYKPRKFISILKLDCEGCEPLALLGAPLLFKYNPPMAMMVEVFPERLSAAGSSPVQFLKQIEDLGYYIYHQQNGHVITPVTETSVSSVMVGEGSIDCVAIYKPFADHDV